MPNPNSCEFETLSLLGKRELGEAIQLRRLPELSGTRRLLRFVTRRAAFAAWYADLTRGMLPRRNDLNELPPAEEKQLP